MKSFVYLISVMCCLITSFNAHADPLEDLIRQTTRAGGDSSASQKDQASDLIMNAMGLLGVAYRFGGNDPTKGLDCSSFMQYIFKQAMNVNLPRTTGEQVQVGSAVSRSDLQPGDMVFFATAGGRRVSHVGMYIGNNRFIHAPRTGKNIEITDMGMKYWDTRYVTARRVKNNAASQFTK